MAKAYTYYSEWTANYLFGIVKEEMTDAFYIFYDSTLPPGTYIVSDALGHVLAYTWMDAKTYTPHYIKEPDLLGKWNRMN
jgi:hypothetical protein